MLSRLDIGSNNPKSDTMKKEIVQSAEAGEVLYNAFSDLGITKNDQVYIKQESNHIVIGRAKTITKSDEESSADLLEFYNPQFHETETEICSKKMLFKMAEEIARLKLESQGKRKKYQSFEELCHKENLEPDEGMELMVEDLIDTAIYHSLLHPEKPFGCENDYII